MILVWQKLNSSGGFNPAFREGHSTGSYEDLMILFGGFEAGRRVNSSLILDVRHSRWSHAPCAGDLPAPRSLSASCTIGSFYIIHGGETSRDNIISTSQINSPNNSFVKNDICPGDSISIAGSKNKNPGIIDTANLCTLDDMYTLEWEVSSSFKKENVRIWRKIPCQLAPLPRCGHTLTLCNVQGKSSCILLGGYSRETNTASSSIHLFYTEDLLKLTTTEKYLNDNEIKNNNNNKRKTSSYLTWRTLECSGQGSGPRHKHSTTLLSGGTDGSSFLAIFGGIGSSGNVLHDIHLLDLDNLTWTSVSTHNAVNKPIGTFSHSAMSIPREIKENDEENDFKLHESKGDLLIIFGGSTSVSDSASACVSGLRCYDPIKHEWSKIKTAYMYPTGRYGHSTAIISGYSPAHTLPTTSGNLPFFPESLGDDENGHCAVIFGGSNVVMQCAETWILDLKWRPNGVQQFDHTHHKRTDHMVKSQLIENEDFIESNQIDDINKSKHSLLNKSSSVPTLMKTNSSFGHSLSNPALSQDSIKLADSAFIKVKRERAQASLLLQRERERAMRAEDREQKLLLEIAALNQQIKDIRENYEKESSQLRKELEVSVKKEAKYRALNEEAYNLLLLHGINDINQ